ncbi:MAG: redox-sensitive transcriptional activator SoxR [Ilumatobacter sp.]|uniref:redox-sensitive transcriptional activator SoxR n=1 Tax=Ilumatobacter sp. TaxID=1967498 RepID=UPI0032968538
MTEQDAEMTQIDETMLTIGELAARAGVATSALRFYESEGLITSERTDVGHRRFLRSTLRRVSFIRVAQQLGLSLDDIRSSLGSLPDGRTPTREDWTELSQAWRPRLDERISMLERLRDRLDGCIGCGCLSLEACHLFNSGDRAAARGTGARFVVGDPI